MFDREWSNFGVERWFREANGGRRKVEKRFLAAWADIIAGAMMREKASPTSLGMTGGVARASQQSGSVICLRAMDAKAITPILNVSDIAASFAWFAKWGWKKCWDWGTPPTFGSVGSGECEIFLCRGAQGSRGKGTNRSTFGPDGDESADKGVWMSVWVADVDEVHRQCVAEGLDVVFPPTNMPWNTREMHLRHPDGHVFRVSKGIGE